MFDPLILSLFAYSLEVWELTTSPSRKTILLKICCPLNKNTDEGGHEFQLPQINRLKYTKPCLLTVVSLNLDDHILLCLIIPFYFFLYLVLDIKLSLLSMIWTVKSHCCWVVFFSIKTLSSSSSSSMFHISFSTDTKCSSIFIFKPQFENSKSKYSNH